MFELRAATANDVKAITEIYNDAVLNTTATFDTEIQAEVASIAMARKS